MSKSKDAFRTISEVADWLETPAHVLRFWESKFTQVKPVKRAGGRRYYRPADMQLLGGIKKLLHDDGLTIKGVQKLLREHGVKHVSALSPHLDDDLVAEAGFIGEAGFMEDVETLQDEGASVLAFPAPRAAPEAKEPAPVQTPEHAASQPPAEGASPTQAATPVPDPQPENTAGNQVQQPDLGTAARAADPAKHEPVDETVNNTAGETTAAAPQTPPTPEPDTPDQAFGGDVPAFMRRAPSADSENGESDTSVAAPAGPSVTIDPVAKLVPMDDAADMHSSPAGAELMTAQSPDIETAMDPADAAPDLNELVESSATTLPDAPMDEPQAELISGAETDASTATLDAETESGSQVSPAAEPDHPADIAASDETAEQDASDEDVPEQAIAAQDTPQDAQSDTAPETAPETAPATETAATPEQASEMPPDPPAPPPAAQRPLVDVPALAKIAPELDSFDAEPGLLDVLPGTQRVSPEMAEALKPHLAELRALRIRMQG